MISMPCAFTLFLQPRARRRKVHRDLLSSPFVPGASSIERTFSIDQARSLHNAACRRRAVVSALSGDMAVAHFMSHFPNQALMWPEDYNDSDH